MKMKIWNMWRLKSNGVLEKFNDFRKNKSNYRNPGCCCLADCCCVGWAGQADCWCFLVSIADSGSDLWLAVDANQ